MKKMLGVGVLGLVPFCFSVCDLLGAVQINGFRIMAIVLLIVSERANDARHSETMGFRLKTCFVNLIITPLSRSLFQLLFLSSLLPLSLSIKL